MFARVPVFQVFSTFMVRILKAKALAHSWSDTRDKGVETAQLQLICSGSWVWFTQQNPQGPVTALFLI